MNTEQWDITELGARHLKNKFIAGGNVLAGSVFETLPNFVGPKVIYAAANRMGGRAATEGITFKQIPNPLEV
jgi:hypothetical protein